MSATLEVSLWPRKIPSRMQLSQIPHFQSRIFFQSCNWIICHSLHTLKTHQHSSHQNSSNSLPEFSDASSLANTDFFEDKLELTHQHQIFAIWFSWSFSFPIWYPASGADQFYISAPVMEIYKLVSASEGEQCSLDSIPMLFLKFCFKEVGPILTNLVNLSLSEGIFPSSFKQALIQPLLKTISIKKNYLSTYPLIHLYPLMISATFVQFQTSTSFPKCSKNSLPPTFDLTCSLTLCLFLNMLTGSFILLKLFFLKFTMTSTL